MNPENPVGRFGVAPCGMNLENPFGPNLAMLENSPVSKAIITSRADMD